jgi:hypothetical protein
MSFEKHFAPDQEHVPSSNDLSSVEGFARCARGFRDFMGRNAGRSFNEGLYRVHPAHFMSHWTTNVLQAFPGLKGRILCFSYDWLGRHFALDRARVADNQCRILMLEPGTGQALEIPVGFVEFHDTELVEHTNEALASDLYASWLASGGRSPRMDQCVGYRKPLFLGGRDSIDNLELSDMDVYWSICSQLISKIRHLPDGTPIRSIDIR